MMPRATAAMTMLVVVLASLVAPRVAVAQDVPVVFLHGLMSSADAWRDTAPRVARDLHITEHRISTDWRDWFERQAAQIHGAFGHLPAETIAVGHSNGGIVAREWSKRRSLRGIVTMGTPHHGALLAERGLDLVGLHYELFDLVNGIAGILTDPKSTFSWLLPWLTTHLNFTAWLAQATTGELLATLGLGYGLPVLGQMRPGSAFLQHLNSSGNLSREASAVQTRVGMVFVAREFWRGGVAVGLAPQYQNHVAESLQIAATMLDAAAAYVYHNYPWHPTAQWLYHRFVSLSQKLRMVDPAWCWAVTNDPTCATSHDGIVATPAQYFPGGVNVGFYGPPHLWQIRESPTLIEDVLVGRLDVKLRSASPPPPTPPPPSTPTWRLEAGQRLRRDDELRSRNGAFRLIYQGDGNLVIYRTGGAATWSSSTHGTSPGSVEMQGDGNLVIYDAAGTPVWHSDTWWAPGAVAELTDEGYLIVFDASGAPVWWSGGE